MASSAACMRVMKPEEAHESYLMEAQIFPVGVASPKEAVEMWHSEVPELCWGYYENGRLVARICGTQFCEARYKEICNYKHEPEGTTVGVHSIMVKQDSRGKGIGTALMKRFLQHIEENFTKVHRVSLVCREAVKPFYENCGFRSHGLAEIELGALRTTMPLLLKS